ncbi:MAG: UbiX family flavin prenyltransferase [Candidatus Omnitrophica bacterium]|nr:UbiX family flavin prenyltransferase [Candidatus Omnitrophota bacterium]
MRTQSQVTLRQSSGQASHKSPEYAIAITGASGVIYGMRLVEVLLEKKIPIYLTVSASGAVVLKEEISLDLGKREGWPNRLTRYFGASSKTLIHYLDERDLAAPISSGSHPLKAVAIVPCSMSTLSGIACGSSGNLIERAADVALKEGRKLIVVPRETPLSAIHLENMLKLARLGVHVLPAAPGFYHRPKKVEEMVDFIVGRVLDLLGVEHNLFKRWRG